MEANHTTMGDLFAQLGLPNDTDSINGFIQKFGGLCESVHLEDAEFWSSQQADFLRTALADDAEWAELIDQLNAMLR